MKNQAKNISLSKKAMAIVFSAALALAVFAGFPKKAEACCSCFAKVSVVEAQQMVKTILKVNKHTTAEFVSHRQWMVDFLWGKNILIICFPTLLLPGD